MISGIPFMKELHDSETFESVSCAEARETGS